MSQCLLSLCIPTNGVSEWVFPVLDSIYSQNADESLFEVILTDNGSNEDFCIKMTAYASQKNNLVYKKTTAFLFENQIEALRLAKGEFLKFVNHRSVMHEGSINWMLELVRTNLAEKPVIYLSNMMLHYKERYESNDFDGFVKGLGAWASWTTGVGIWKTDFERIPADKVYNKISPHSDILFSERTKTKYIIDDTLWSHEIDRDHSKKGKYDLYKAFGVEEFLITLQLFLDGSITAKTLKSVKSSYEKLITGFYLQFSIVKRPCSYMLAGFDDAMGIFFSKKKIVIRAWLRLPRYCLGKIKARFINRIVCLLV